ncbi:uncharacterized protein LOC117173503 [Belonocnema kinseyi]|uniref:uncharacterized protein LOC117173503 n=1 Tax=Belonocnema kinseyi TaxID=2817044 RepID=UPI00143DABA0|nr:uncharacterized protein LOC117173503 [Belonocnema kinseyi]
MGWDFAVTRRIQLYNDASGQLTRKVKNKNQKLEDVETHADSIRIEITLMRLQFNQIHVRNGCLVP